MGFSDFIKDLIIYDKDGFDKNGWNKARIHKISGSEYYYGYNKHGYDKRGLKKRGNGKRGYCKYSPNLDLCRRLAYYGYSYVEDRYDEDGEEYSEETEFNKNLKKIKSKIKKVSNVDLSKKEITQLAEYIYLFEEYDCDEHWEVNEIITTEKKWGEFKKLRSKNNHGYTYSIKGIKPKYFAIVCDVLDIDAGNGEPLIDYESY